MGKKTYTPVADWVLVQKVVDKVVQLSPVVDLQMPDVTANARARWVLLDWGDDTEIQDELFEGAEIIIAPDTWAVPCSNDTDNDLFIIKETNICAIIS